MRLTVLGLGGMGWAFAARATERGHQVTVWNRTPGRASELVGVTEAPTVAEAVAEAEVTLVVVADDDAVLDICLGIDGALASVAKGAILANVSTVDPETARELATAGPADAVLDTPVLGSPTAVRQGAARFLIGGPADVVRRLDPLWADLSRSYVHCGAAGAGATMKVMTNLQLIVGVAALAEAIATARADGMDDNLIRTVFAGSPAVSAAARIRQDAVLDPAHPGWFTPELARKDVRLAVRLAERHGIPVQLGPATENLLTTVLSAGGQWPDFAAVIEALTPK
ncbi:MAG TPA: NAD(P)-dependent oxidoreductase [Pseudonocardiaceae bacterium]